MTEVVISGTGLFTPPFAISNAELVASFNQYVDDYNQQHAEAIKAGTTAELAHSSAEFIEKASGIKQRYVMEKEGILNTKIMHPQIPERSNDQISVQCEMALAAAKEALAQAHLDGQDLDAVYVACSNFSRPYPAIAVELQHELGIKNGFGYDMNMACSSATFGIQTAYNAIKAGQAKRVLVVTPEICTAHLNFADRESHFIFGDACTATILEEKSIATAKQCFEIVSAQLITQYSNNIRNNFGYLNRLAPGATNQADKLFIQQGRKVFKEVVPMVVELIESHLASQKLTAGDVQRFWLHQANINMNQLIAKKLLGKDVPAQMTPITLDKYANTSSCGAIIAFHLHRENLNTGDYGVICSFGAGYSAGCLIVRAV